MDLKGLLAQLLGQLSTYYEFVAEFHDLDIPNSFCLQNEPITEASMDARGTCNAVTVHCFVNKTL